MKTLKTNQFWGRRSGKVGHVGRAQGAFRTNAFIQMQWGAGTSVARKKFKRSDKSPNVNNQWFGKTYKSKRGEAVFGKRGQKKK